MSPEGWAAIAVAAATVLLAIITAYYASETHGMRDEMRKQREGEAARRVEAHRSHVRQLRHAVATELRQLLANIDSKRGTGRLFVHLSTDAWRSTFSESEIWPDELRGRLFHIYDEVARMNAIRDLLLAQETIPLPDGAVSRFDSGGFGLERATSLDFLKRDIVPALGMIDGLPDPS